MVAFLSKPTESDGFEQIVDFLNAHPIRNPTRNDIQVPQPSGPTESVADEAVHKELGDRLATPNEPSSQGIDSGGGPKCQETIRDTTAQTRFESVFKHFNNSLLARGNTLQSDKDRLKLDELMKLCTKLQNMVLDLKKTTTTQRNKIDSLKRRVKKLKRRNRSRTHKLKRLYKVGLSARVESFSDEESLGEDASKQGRRIDAIDADEDITLVSVQDDANKEMFDVDDLGGEEMFIAGQNKNVIEEVVDAAQDDIQAKIDADHQLAERLQAQEQEELPDAEKATLFQQFLEKKESTLQLKEQKRKETNHQQKLNRER
nr:hypothetical protein [Tanacetum cinerariifolium]